MGKYFMHYYGGKLNLKTNDLLTAVKTTANYEGSLYENGHLIFSPSELGREETTKILKEKGIETYLANNCYNYRYSDPDKNIKKYFAYIFDYSWNGLIKLQVHIATYRELEKEIEFNTVEDVLNHIRNEYVPLYGKNNIHVNLFEENKCYSLEEQL